MSAPMKFDLEGATPLGKDTPAPGEHAIVPRDRRFCREDKPGRWWLRGDPLATSWHNALSVAFPKGEALFIEMVRAHRGGASEKLAAEIQAFIRQEANHTREHLVFNRAARDAGYDLSGIERRIDQRLAEIRERPPIVNLAASTMLEHLTALLARETLANPHYLGDCEGEPADLWRWHAVEEIEHKAVAYDTWLHATRNWSRWRRWSVKTYAGLVASRNFMFGRYTDTVELLEQDGLTGIKWKWRVVTYLLGKPGVLRRTWRHWISYFLPGFHPWQQDDRALIARYDSEFPDALLVQEEEVLPLLEEEVRRLSA